MQLDTQVRKLIPWTLSAEVHAQSPGMALICPTDLPMRRNDYNFRESVVQKNPPEKIPGGFAFIATSTKAYAFIAAFTASAVIGSERTRAPTALKIALPIAGAITVTAGSPTPVACSPLAITLTATSGSWLIRRGV